MGAPSPVLRAVWDAIPSTGCKGFCSESCGPIGCGPEETRLLAERGIELPDVLDTLRSIIDDGADVPTCPALVNGRCSVYEVRPTICRLWGSVERMRCPWGCVPADGYLPDEKAADLLALAARVAS